jgi:hypothetical protein
MGVGRDVRLVPCARQQSHRRERRQVDVRALIEPTSSQPTAARAEIGPQVPRRQGATGTPGALLLRDAAALKDQALGDGDLGEQLPPTRRAQGRHRIRGHPALDVRNADHEVWQPGRPSLSAHPPELVCGELGPPVEVLLVNGLDQRQRDQLFEPLVADQLRGEPSERCPGRRVRGDPGLHSWPLETGRIDRRRCVGPRAERGPGRQDRRRYPARQTSGDADAEGGSIHARFEHRAP